MSCFSNFLSIICVYKHSCFQMFFFFVHLFDWTSQSKCFFLFFFKGLVGVFTHKIVPFSNRHSSTSSFLTRVSPFLRLTAWLAKVNLRSDVLFLLVTARHPGCTESCQHSRTSTTVSKAGSLDTLPSPPFWRRSWLEACCCFCLSALLWMEDHTAATSCVLLPITVCVTLLSRGKLSSNPGGRQSQENLQHCTDTLLCPTKLGRQSTRSPFSYLSREMAVSSQGHRQPLLLSLTSGS